MSTIAGKPYNDDGRLLMSGGAVPAGTPRLAGWSTSASNAYGNSLGAGAVPAGAFFINGIAFDTDGAIYCTLQGVAATDRFISGMAVRADGALRISTTIGGFFIHGGAVNSDGSVSQQGIV